MGPPPLPIQRSGISLSRKAWTRREKWGGAPFNWKTVPTGTWRKAVFSITARKVSQSLQVLENKGPVTVIYQSAPHTHLQRISLMFRNIVRIFTSPYTTTVPVDCYIHMKRCFIRKTVSLVFWICRTWKTETFCSEKQKEANHWTFCVLLSVFGALAM